MSDDFLDEHLMREVTTLCHCWRLTLRDGTVYGFTDHDRELEVDGTTFAPHTGLSATEARSSLGLATDSVDVEGALSSAQISETEIAEGRFDGATVETVLVNWSDTTQYRSVRKASIAEIKRADGAFVATLESFGSEFDQRRGRLIRRECDAELGDLRCGVDVAAATMTAAVVVGQAGPGNAIRIAALETFAPGTFSGGSLSWTGGIRQGTSDRVVSDVSVGDGRVLTLWPRNAPMPEAGDAFSLTTGCDKRFTTCKTRFNNELNFRGFPHLPGNDQAYGYVNEDDIFDGGPIVP